MDMACHSLEAARFLLTEPGKPRTSLRVVRVAAQIASLKWTRPEYVEKLKQWMGPEVDYSKEPAEDFARATVLLEDEEGRSLVAEVTTSWSFVGPGLRLSFELLGPEYSLSANSLESGLRIFFSREVQGPAGEDLVEKQNAEQGWMPVVEDEALSYGYVAENRHMVRAFLDRRVPDETWHDGLAVTELLMACYKAAEEGRTLEFHPEELQNFVPQVAQGSWRG